MKRKIIHTPIPDLTWSQIREFLLYVKWDAKTGCYLWDYRKDKYNRGRWSVNKKNLLAARIMYKIRTGRDPGKWCVCHYCDNPRCVNPAHFFLDTQYGNIKDRDRKGRNVIPKGSQAGTSILVEADIPVIRSMRGVKTQEEIAQMYGVAPSTISHIMTGRNWGHIP